MARNKEKINQRNRQIFTDYAHMYFIEGKRDEVILPELEQKWYLAQSTIEKIILKESKKSQ